MWLVCGEALMDVFGGEDTPGGLALEARVGGSPLNTAIALARLAQPVAFFGAVSRGFLGDRLVRAMAAEQLDLRVLQRVDAPTTLGLVGLDDRGVPSYDFYGHAAADRQLRPDHLPVLRRLPVPWRGLHVGSYATVVEPIAATLRALVDEAATSGTTLVSFDPNVRRNVVPDLAPWRAQLDWMLPRTTVLKASDEDLALLRPGVAADEFARQALAAGVALVVVTRGAAGAVAWSRASGPVAQAAMPVAVVDTVGAGDTFQAALLCWLAERGYLSPDAVGRLEGAAVAEALSFAARAAALTCARRGADMPRRALLD